MATFPHSAEKGKDEPIGIGIWLGGSAGLVLGGVAGGPLGSTIGGVIGALLVHFIEHYELKRRESEEGG
ncbi:MAG: hypothetical protein ACE5KV_01740 [Thermoplasmata archaeon]